MTRPVLLLRLPRWSPGVPLDVALHDVRWALYSVALYVVGTALVCMLCGVAELQGTAEGMRHLPERVPWWQAK